MHEYISFEPKAYRSLCPVIIQLMLIKLNWNWKKMMFLHTATFQISHLMLSMPRKIKQIMKKRRRREATAAASEQNEMKRKKKNRINAIALCECLST